MAWYRTGTVAVTNGSATVTGTGTAFVANVQIGHAINLPDGKAYEVLSVDSNAQITLGSNYLGSTASGQAYSIQPNQGFAQQAASALATLLSQFTGYITTALAGRFGDGSAGAPGVSFSGEQSSGFFRRAVNIIGLSIAGTERFTFSGADVGIGTTSPADKLHIAGGFLRIENATNSRVIYNSSGNGTNLKKAQSYVAGDGTYRMSLLNDAENTEGTSIVVAPGILSVAVDSGANLGTSALRWGTVFAVTGTINTSDEREKAWRDEPSEAELDAAWDCFNELGFYQWSNEVAEKGVNNARFHFGMRAQRVWAIFAQNGLVDPIVNGRPGATPHAMLCYDEWEDRFEPVYVRQEIDGIENFVTTGQVELKQAAGNRFGFRTDQLDRLMIAALKRESDQQAARIAALEALADAGSDTDNG